MSENDGDNVPVRALPETERTEEVTNVFAAKYKKRPDFYVRVPGRVNLIGEHIDYSGYGVCPMALEQDVFLAVSVEEDKKLRLHNLDPKFHDFECDMSGVSISRGDGAPEWHQYFLCGIKGILDVLPKNLPVKGMKVAVGGTVPQSAGLSSSSALVSAAALAAAHAHDYPMPKKKIASLCAECERHIGTQGGGMDQAIAFLASEGCAKFIEFNPLRSTDVTLPAGAVFVIAHSLAELNKAATADYNCRVVECRLAGQIMARRRGLDYTAIRKLGDLQQALKADLPSMISIVEQTLHEAPYTKAEIIRELETTSDRLDDTSLTQNTRHIPSFKLRQRALHVFREALRVEKFHSVCASSSNDPSSLQILGQLMSESHDSLRDLYECSHPKLDKLVELSRDLAFGCRLTGAGWGGCVVALVPPENLERYLNMLKEKYYKQELGNNRPTASLLFATSPKAGACIYTNKT